MTDFLIYLATGAFAGVLSGIFGIGGGIVVVPSLLYVFHYTQMPHPIIMHFAAGTSLTVMILTTSSSSYAHNRKKHIRWDVFYRLLPGLLVGAIAGVVLADFLHSSILKKIFAIFLFYAATDMMFFSKKAKVGQESLPSNRLMRFFGGVVGTFTGLLGGGSGSMIVPLLSRYRMQMIESVGTASLCGFSIAIIGTLACMVTGLNEPNRPVWSTGYVYWPAVLGIGIASFICAPLGAKISRRLPEKIAKCLFAVVMFLVGLKMMMGS